MPTPRRLATIVLVLFMLAIGGCSSSSSSDAKTDEAVFVVATATAVPSTPTPEPTPEPTLVPIPTATAVAVPSSDGTRAEWPIRVESDNGGIGWPDTPSIPETQAGRDAREAELVDLLATYTGDSSDPRTAEAALLRLELTRLRQPKAEALALEYRILTSKILVDPLNVTDAEIARHAEISNPNSPLSTFGERLLDEMINEDDEYLDDGHLGRFEVVGSVMNGYTVLVTVCGETTGIWRSLSTDQITLQTGGGPVNSIYSVATIDPQMYVQQLTNPGAVDGCSLATVWPK